MIMPILTRTCGSRIKFRHGFSKGSVTEPLFCYGQLCAMVFYGFRFAMMGLFAAGLKSDWIFKHVSDTLYTGIGIGLMIKNDNLIFPTFLISAFAYPSPAAGVPGCSLISQAARIPAQGL